VKRGLPATPFGFLLTALSFVFVSLAISTISAVSPGALAGGPGTIYNYDPPAASTTTLMNAHTGALRIYDNSPQLSRLRVAAFSGRLAAKGVGNVAAGVIRNERALGAGERWLGEGYREIAPGVYRSADNTRQFRMTASDLGAKNPHVHFESIGPNGREITENAHVYLK
jgi:hypothetical protein